MEQRCTPFHFSPQPATSKWPITAPTQHDACLILTTWCWYNFYLAVVATEQPRYSAVFYKEFDMSLCLLVIAWEIFYLLSQWASCQIGKIAGCACAGKLGTFFPPPQVSDPDMHHGTCVTHVSWCMPGLLTSGFLWSRWWGKRSRHSWCMHNPQIYVSGKRSIAMPSWYMQYSVILGGHILRVILYWYTISYIFCQC